MTRCKTLSTPRRLVPSDVITTVTRICFSGGFVVERASYIMMSSFEMCSNALSLTLWHRWECTGVRSISF